MNVESMVQGLQDSLPDIFNCTATPSGSVRVRTRLTYPDGTLVDLFLMGRDDGAVVVTDYGDTIGWLRMQSARGLTRGQNRKITKVCQSLNVARTQNRVTVIARDCRALGEPVIRVAQAAVLISHIGFS
ncbi:MAG: DUF1828 domain-containing protein [Dehalococcoidia bacterium]|nr:DUF1828 domain-containing protein [Dehalococcoidia bacterium]